MSGNVTHHPDCRLRQVTMTDAEKLLEWVNDPDDRANSFSSEPITMEEHVAWLERSLSDSDMHLYIMTDGSDDVGHIKMRVENGVGDLGYCVAPEHRGKGYASDMISLMAEEVRERISGVSTVVADVKPGNVGSRKALERAGFKEAMVRYELDLN